MNCAFRLHYAWTLISVLVLIMVTRHFIWILFYDFSVWQSLQHLCSIKKVAAILEGTWSHRVWFEAKELFPSQYCYQESLIRSKVCKENTDSGEIMQWKTWKEALRSVTESLGLFLTLRTGHKPQISQVCWQCPLRRLRQDHILTHRHFDSK